MLSVPIFAENAKLPAAGCTPGVMQYVTGPSARLSGMIARHVAVKPVPIINGALRERMPCINWTACEGFD